MADLWPPEMGPMPARCGPCELGHHDAHLPLFETGVGGVRYGPFACGCLCDDDAAELAVTS